MEGAQAPITYTDMKVKHILTKAVFFASLLCNIITGSAQDTINVAGIGGQIIKNPNGTFFYSNTMQIAYNKGKIITLSYGRWKQINDSIIAFTSSKNTKQEILKTCESYDTLVSDGFIVEIKDENGDLLCKRDNYGTHFYGESSILGININDTTIQIHGVSQYGQWHLSNIRGGGFNHQVIYIRDAFFYNLEYLSFLLLKKYDGYRLIRYGGLFD